MADSNAQQEFNLRDYWQILVRRRWLIYTCVLVATVTAGVASFLATPLYRAAATVNIERTPPRITQQSLTASQHTWLDYQNWYNTQYQLFTSRAILRRAVDKLDLMTDPRFAGEGEEVDGASLMQKMQELKTRVVRTLSRTTVPPAPDDEYDRYIRILRGGMSVAPMRDTHIVEVAFVDPDRVFAAEAANAISKAYQEFTLSERTELAEQASGFFIEQLAELKKETTEAEIALRAYAIEHQIVTGDSQDVALQNLSDVRNRLMSGRTDLAEAKARWDTVRRSEPDAIAEVRQNQLIQNLESKVAELEREHSRQRATFGEGLPKVQETFAELGASREKLAAETELLAQKIRGAARSDYLQKRQAVEELQALYDQQAEQVNELQEAFIEYESLEQEVARKRAILEDLLERQNQMRLAGSLGETGHNVRIIDEARPARNIFKPKKKLNTALGFLFGLFLGVGAAFLMEYIDNTLKTPDDVRAVLKSPLLGMIPALDVLGKDAPQEGRKKRRRGRREGGRRAPALDPGLVSHRMPLSPIAESYRELRNAILLATPGHPPRDFAVTSCQPGEGKTTTALNMATALAQLGRRVLLVDTDLRRPRCHQVLKAASTRGVSTYLTGAGDARTLVQPTEIDGVFLLPAGPIPPNPAELLDAPRFLELVAELRSGEHWDHIIYDSPPVLSVVDPLVIGRHTEGLVVVVRSGFTTREAGRLGMQKIEQGRIRHLFGIVLNAVETEHVPYQYRYYRTGYRRDEPAGDAEEAPTLDRPRPAAASGTRDA
jgi:capsular exopolysaccharide synthesis family protein